MAKCRRKKCGYCGLRHHAVRQFEGVNICAACDYLDLVRKDSFDLQEAIKFLRKNLLCAYCGEPSTDVEHVIPRSSGLPTFTVPACRECNGIARDLVFSGFQAKSDYIKAEVRKKYANVFKTPEWDEEELAELGYALRKQVRAYQEAREQLQQRLDWHWLNAVLAKE